ncbi:MAG: hypothetical protein V4714_16400 [Bacteroidota bacterium]
MTREEKLDRMLEYLNEGKAMNNLPNYCTTELGMDTEEYQTLVDRLLRDEMAEWRNAEKNLLSITIEGKFLLRTGGYVILAFSKNYQKKLAREAWAEKIKSVLPWR